MINIIIQARTTSRRLPGKVLRKIDGKPLLGYVIERCLRAKSCQKVIVATTGTDFQRLLQVTYPYEVGLFGYGAGKQVSDVAERFRACLEEHPCDGFVRICADSPLIDPAIIDTCVHIVRNGQNACFTDYLTPDGFNVQVCRTETFRNSLKDLNRGQREHVLTHIDGYRYTLPEIPLWAVHMKPKFTVDTADDLKRMRRLIGEMEDHHDYGYLQCLTLWNRLIG